MNREKIIKKLKLDESKGIHCMFCIHAKLIEPVDKKIGAFLKCLKHDKTFHENEGNDICMDYVDEES